MISARPRPSAGRRVTHSTSSPLLRRALAAGAITVLGSSLALAGLPSATAASQGAQARAQFVGGSVLGSDLGAVLALRSAEARSGGSDPTSTRSNPLSAEALRSVTVGSGAPVTVDLGRVLQWGAAGQYAQAKADGSARAATGAITDQGGITVGKDVAGGSGDASVDLGSLLGPRFTAQVADLDLAVKALAAQATASAGAATGQYSIADARLRVTSPAIADASGRVRAALDAVRGDLSRLSGPSGTISREMAARLARINPLLNTLGAGAHVTVSIDTDPNQLLQSLLDTRYGTGAVSFDLQAGTIDLDLAKLVGGRINSLRPGTELLSDAAVRPALLSVTSTLSTIADQLVARLRAQILQASVTVHADVTASSAQAPVLSTVCDAAPTGSSTGGSAGASAGASAGTGAGSGSGLGGVVGGVVGGLGSLGGAVGGTSAGAGVAGGSGVASGATGIVGGVLCRAVSTPRPALPTTLAVDIAGTVGGLSRGAATSATARLTLLGTPGVGVDVQSLVGGIGSTLADGLLDGDGSVARFASALQSGFVQPAVAGLLSDPGSVSSALTDAVSVTANDQGNSGGMFSQTALRVRVLPIAGASAADLRLATASVAGDGPGTGGPGTGGPGTGGPGTGGPGSGGPGSGGPGTGDPGSAGTGSHGGVTPAALTAGGFGRLATTGIGIGILLILVVALGVTGVYLVRHGYLRRPSLRGTATRAG